jgi:signal transduction histidine kinase
MVEKKAAATPLESEFVLKAIPQPLLVLDAGFTVLFANAAFLKNFHVVESQLLGVPLWRMNRSPWHDARFLTLLEDALSGQPAGLLEMDDDFPLIGRRTLAFQALLLPRPDDTPHLLLVVNDATEAANARDRAASDYDQLVQSNRVMTEFANFAAHDLQVPLKRISRLCELAKNDLRHGKSDAAANQLDSLLVQAERMAEMIQNLLRLGSVGAAPGIATDVALDGVLNEVLEALKDEIAAAEARVGFGELPLVKAPRSQLAQIFTNLIHNALRYQLPGRKLMIKIRSFATDDGLEIRVEDNGRGFDPALVTEIFKPFRRLTGAPEGGTGLGLTIGARIMESLGGSIRAESFPTVGTAFYLSFPRGAMVE